MTGEELLIELHRRYQAEGACVQSSVSRTDGQLPSRGHQRYPRQETQIKRA